MLSPGTLLAGRFEIERLAGTGGMGSVYRARDWSGEATVAVKLLHEPQARGDDLERFAREAELLRELRHPGIVDYVAHGQTTEGEYYLAMEWLEGHDLTARLVAGPPLEVGESLAILAQAAAAVGSAHQRGVVHRDLKPSNLFLVGGRADQVKVLDFGIARSGRPSSLTRTGLVLGTPDYMAPEQARGARQLTPAADVFALGCVVYECLSGHRPFAAEHVAAVLTRILFDDPAPLARHLPGIDPALATLVERMLVKDAEGRLRDGEALGTELARMARARGAPSATTRRSAPAAPLLDADRGPHAVILASAAGAAPADLDLALAAARARHDWLLDGTLVVSVRGFDSAFDLAEQAAGVALLVKKGWPAAEVVLATGVDASEHAAGLLRSLAGPVGAGVWLDPLSARLLARRFELVLHAGVPTLRAGAARVDEDRTLLGQPTVCVGREQELGALEAALNGCIDDAEARAVLVVAGPGLGKSRLRHELARRLAARGLEALVLLGTGEIASAGAPYGVLRQAVRRLAGLETGAPAAEARERIAALAGSSAHTACFLGELAGVPFPDGHHPALATARANPQVMQEQIHFAFAAFVGAAARARPVLLVLDDLQWGDALSIALVDHLLRELDSAAFLVLALARPELAASYPALWDGRRVQRLVLPALSRRASERLLAHVLADRLPAEKMARLVELSAGNPLFLEELARTAAEDADAPPPATVIAMLEARVDRLPPEQRRLLCLASVLGQAFVRRDLRALAHAVLGASDAVDGILERLAAAELIARDRDGRGAGSEYSFRHALVRDATYQLLGAEDRRQLHARAAEILARGPDPDAIVVAEHWQRSATPARAIPWLLEAARVAFARCDLPAAMGGVQRALALGPTGTIRGTLRAVEGLCLGYTGRLPIAALDEALELLPTGDTFWCMACHLRLAVAVLTGGWDEVAPLAARFLAAEPSDEAIAEYVTGAGTLSTIFVHAGLPGPAHQFFDRVEAVAPRRADLPLVEAWRVWSAACILDVDGAPAVEVLRACERAAELYLGVANQRNAFFCEGHAAVMLAEAGDEAQAIARLRHAIVEAGQLSEDYVRVWLSCRLAQLLAGTPAHAEALAIADGIIAAGVAPPCPGSAHGIRARALLAAGRVEEAERAARAGLASVGWAPGFALVAAAALVDALVALGRDAEALAVGEAWLARAAPNASMRGRREALFAAIAAVRENRG